MDNIIEMRMRLESHPDVTGLIEYGSRSTTGTTNQHQPDNGDYDLIAILTDLIYPVTSLHFDMGSTPVDLNLLTLKELQALKVGTSFEADVIATGRVIYDPTGVIQIEQSRLAEEAASQSPDTWSPHDIAFIRHGHRHLLDKVEGRLESDPTLCRMLLNTNLYWLLENYFRLRYLPFQGIKAALNHVQHHDPTLYERIEQFYATTELVDQVQVTEGITALVLAPIGGMWRQGEILTFGNPACRNLPQQGEAVYTYLFKKGRREGDSRENHKCKLKCLD